jgi:hypothetical protein
LGYADDAGSGVGEIRVPGAFLPKPFTVEALNRAISRAVEVARPIAQPPKP